MSDSESIDENNKENVMHYYFASAVVVMKQQWGNKSYKEYQSIKFELDHVASELDVKKMFGYDYESVENVIIMCFLEWSIQQYGAW